MTQDVLGGMIALAAPLLLCALGGLISGKGGVRNLALEGSMIVGGVAGCLMLTAMEEGGAPVMPPQVAVALAILAAGLAGAIFALPLAFSAKKADTQLVGVALNLLSPALCVAVILGIMGRFGGLAAPDWAKLPVNGDSQAWKILLYRPYLTTPVALLLVILTALLLYRTPWGLRLRMCGECADMVKNAGFEPQKVRGAGVVFSGLLCGISGLAFIASVGTQGGNVVAGWGFVALAAVIAGGWRMGGTVIVCLMISLLWAFAVHWQKLADIPGGEHLALAAPYALALILSFLGGRGKAPREETISLDADER